MTIEPGKAAPAFTLNDQTGRPLSLKSLRGKYVVVYFYPRDDTPGCTREACGFRDHIDAYADLNCVVVGISPDDAATHTQFIEKFNLPFTLLSDPQKRVMQRYQAWGEKAMYGKKVIGTIRSTVVIDPLGCVLKHWKKVPKAADHPSKVLDFLRQSLA